MAEDYIPEMKVLSLQKCKFSTRMSAGVKTIFANKLCALVERLTSTKAFSLYFLEE
jgi:hypothetical protein